MSKNKLLAKAFDALSKDDSFFEKAVKKLSKDPELTGMVTLLKTVRTRGYVTDFEIAQALDCPVEEINAIVDRNPEIKKNSFTVPAGNG